MVRLLIAGVMVLMAGSANAITNEILYKYCKSYADDNFEFTQEHTVESVSCFSYISGVGQLMRYNCETQSPYRAAYQTKDTDAIVQDYLNRIKNQPKDWKYAAADDVARSVIVISKECE